MPVLIDALGKFRAFHQTGRAPLSMSLPALNQTHPRPSPPQETRPFFSLDPSCSFPLSFTFPPLYWKTSPYRSHGHFQGVYKSPHVSQSPQCHHVGFGPGTDRCNPPSLLPKRAQQATPPYALPLKHFLADPFCRNKRSPPSVTTVSVSTLESRSTPSAASTW